LYIHIPSHQGRLAWQDAVMESEAFISIESSCISKSRRTRAGWLARAGFYDFGSQSISTTVLYSKQLAPGRAIIPIFQLRLPSIAPAQARRAGEKSTKFFVG